MTRKGYKSDEIVSGVCIGQVVVYEGRAAVPMNALLGGFQKVFFCQPRTYDLFGRVQVILAHLHLGLGARFTHPYI